MLLRALQKRLTQPKAHPPAWLAASLLLNTLLLFWVSVGAIRKPRLRLQHSHPTQPRPDLFAVRPAPGRGTGRRPCLGGGRKRRHAARAALRLRGRGAARRGWPKPSAAEPGADAVDRDAGERAGAGARRSRRVSGKKREREREKRERERETYLFARSSLLLPRAGVWRGARLQDLDARQLRRPHGVRGGERGVAGLGQGGAALPGGLHRRVQGQHQHRLCVLRPPLADAAAQRGDGGLLRRGSGGRAHGV
jgi:hypothetical protein